MGSEMGHMSMYYTDDEPPVDIIGKKRHWFAKPSIKGMSAVTGAGGPGPAGMESQEVVAKNPEVVEAIRVLFSSPMDMK